MNRVMKEDIASILAEPVNWEKLKDKVILITGAGGMIGSYLIMTLIELNRDRNWGMVLYGLVRNPEKIPDYISSEIKIICQNVTDPIEADVQFDYILHTASPASPLIMREDPVGTIAANVLGTWNTLKLAKESNAEGYLFVSSREIYGQPYDGQQLFNESTYGFVDPLEPRSCYPEGKKAAETMCVSYHAQFGLNVKSARLAHTYGPGMSINDGRVQADFLRDVVNCRDIVLKSDGSAVRTYTYVRDAVAAIFYILLNAPIDEIAYNISSEDDTVSIRKLAETMISACPDRNLHLVFDIPKEKTNDGTAPFTTGILSSDKIRNLGWRPRVKLIEGIRRTVQYLESNE